MALKLDVFPKSLVKARYESAQDDGVILGRGPNKLVPGEKKNNNCPCPFIMKRRNSDQERTPRKRITGKRSEWGSEPPRSRRCWTVQDPDGKQAYCVRETTKSWWLQQSDQGSGKGEAEQIV